MKLQTPKIIGNLLLCTQERYLQTQFACSLDEQVVRRLDVASAASEKEDRCGVAGGDSLALVAAGAFLVLDTFTGAGSLSFALTAIVGAALPEDACPSLEGVGRDQI